MRERVSERTRETERAKRRKVEKRTTDSFIGRSAGGQNTQKKVLQKKKRTETEEILAGPVWSNESHVARLG